MTQKIIDVVGTSDQSFAKAAEAAVKKLPKPCATSNGRISSRSTCCLMAPKSCNIAPPQKSISTSKADTSCNHGDGGRFVDAPPSRFV